MQPLDNLIYKRLYTIGFVGYFLLFLLAVLFYKERIVFADTALHAFELVNGDFFIQNMRFGAAATQLYTLYWP